MRDLEGTERRYGRVILLVTMMTLIMIFIIPSLAETSDSTEGSWEIWLVPNKYTINRGEKLEIAFGITGYGDLDPLNIKIAIYSERNTLLKLEGDSARYDIYLIAPNESAPKDRFKTKEPRAPKNIYLTSDYNSGFPTLYVTPTSSGDKKISFVATYLSDGIHWKTTTKEFNYHVNSWTEKNQTWLAGIGIVLAFLAVGPGPLPIWVWKKILRLLIWAWGKFLGLLIWAWKRIFRKRLK